MSYQLSEIQTFVDLLQWRATERPDQVAYTFLEDGEAEERQLTYAELNIQAQTIATQLQRIIQPGDRTLLAYPPGLEFIAGFFGCLYAGVIPVPVYPPHPKRPSPRLDAIAQNADAQLILTTEKSASKLSSTSPHSALNRLPILSTDVETQVENADWKPPILQANDLAFLQYTSGSTGDPKGVMVSHGNLLHNQAMIAAACQHDETMRGVGWLPLFHDMGLIGNVLQPLYLGASITLMSPVAFLQKPIRWLRAISTYRATSSGGPNFGYELCIEKIRPEDCADLDLSSWQVAFSGAEPVRPDTMAHFAETFAPYGFEQRTFYPAYGLAEATFFVAGGDHQQQPHEIDVNKTSLEQGTVVVDRDIDGKENTQAFASCGHDWLGQQTLIVHPEQQTICPEGQVGELWVSGPSVAQGYWNRPELTKATFDAHLADTDANSPQGPFLRTGDLGFIQNGELFITGRLKDLIIIRGRNHYPQDIEWSVANAHPALEAGNGAAFSVESSQQGADHSEKLIVVQEVKRTSLRSMQDDAFVQEVITAIRSSIAQKHNLQVETIVLLRPASIPKTSSGKIQRRACRNAFLNNTLSVVTMNTLASQQPGLASPDTPDAPASPKRQHHTHAKTNIPVTTETIQRWLMEWFGEKLQIPTHQVDPTRAFVDFGIDSVMSVELIQDLEDWFAEQGFVSSKKAQLEPTLAWNYPTIRDLADFVSGEYQTGREVPSSDHQNPKDIEVVSELVEFSTEQTVSISWQITNRTSHPLTDVHSDARKASPKQRRNFPVDRQRMAGKHRQSERMQLLTEMTNHLSEDDLAELLAAEIRINKQRMAA